MNRPSFPDGCRITIANDWPEQRGPVHIRTPHYMRGALGTVKSCLGAFPNPEDLAFGRPAAVIALYHVVVDATAIWADTTADSIVVEIFEHWLEHAP